MENQALQETLTEMQRLALALVAIRRCMCPSCLAISLVLKVQYALQKNLHKVGLE